MVSLEFSLWEAFLKFFILEQISTYRKIAQIVSSPNLSFS